MEVPEEVQEQLHGVKTALDGLEEVLMPFLDVPPRELAAQVRRRLLLLLPLLSEPLAECTPTTFDKTVYNHQNMPMCYVILTQLTPVERVKVQLALAQAVAVLFKLYCSLAAAKLPESHPFHRDMVRETA
jgi:hypothetical protein